MASFTSLSDDFLRLRTTFADDVGELVIAPVAITARDLDWATSAARNVQRTARPILVTAREARDE